MAGCVFSDRLIGTGGGACLCSILPPGSAVFSLLDCSKNHLEGFMPLTVCPPRCTIDCGQDRKTEILAQYSLSSLQKDGFQSVQATQQDEEGGYEMKLKNLQQRFILMRSNLIAYLTYLLTPALFGLVSLAVLGIAVAAPCTGPGAPSNTQTKCLTAIPIPGVQLKSFDISFFNPQRNEYYLGDPTTMGVDVIDTVHLTFVRTAGLDKPFKGIVLNKAGTAVRNAASGPAGVVSHGRWLYAGDGDSTLHVIDLQAPAGSETKQVIATGGSLRVDEMALPTDGRLLITANNADEPAFLTLFSANGDNAASSVAALLNISVDTTILPTGFGLGIEQPAWDPQTKRFYTSIPTIANNPPGCNYGQAAGDVTCSGGLLVTDPAPPTAVQGAYEPAANAGVIPVNASVPTAATPG